MRWIGVMLCVLGVGCDDGDAEVEDAAVMEAGMEIDAGGDGAPLDAGADGAVDAGMAVCPTEEEAARVVTLVVENQSEAVRYVPVSGDLCDPFTLHDGDGRVPRRVVNVCSEECACLAGTPNSWATNYARLMPGQRHVFRWDGLRVERCEREVFCPEFEGRGRDPRFNVAEPVPVNAAAGMYRVVVGYETVLPDGCEDDGTGETVACQGPRDMSWFGLCLAGEAADVPFALMEAGNTEVIIALP